MTEIQINKRKKAAIWIIKNFTHESCKKIMFSDENWLDADGQTNSKNDIIYAKNREYANNIKGRNLRTKFPFKVMIWCGITYNGVFQVIVLPSKKSFTADFYIEKIIPIIKRDGNRLIGDDFFFDKMVQAVIHLKKQPKHFRMLQ